MGSSALRLALADRRAGGRQDGARYQAGVIQHGHVADVGQHRERRLGQPVSRDLLIARQWKHSVSARPRQSHWAGERVQRVDLLVVGGLSEAMRKVYGGPCRRLGANARPPPTSGDTIMLWTLAGKLAVA